MVSTRTQVMAARSGDTTAFAELVRDHGSAVCAITTAILGDATAGEEVGQEVFVCAWQGLHRLQDPDRFGSWLRGIARNRARDALRRRIHRREIAGDALMQVADSAPAPDDRLDGDRQESTLWDTLKGLDDDHREVLVLYYREGRSVEQVARQLGVTEPTARKRLSRARERLRDGVEDRLSDRLVRSAPRVALFVAAVGATIAALPARAAFAAPAGWVPKAGVAAIVGVAAVSVLTVGTYGRVRSELPEIAAPRPVLANVAVEAAEAPTSAAAELPDHVVHAFLAAEDARFYEHGALDVRAIGRAVLHNWTAGDVRQGGSTLTQQLAKRLVVDQMPEPTIRRKIAEAVMAVELERRLTKDQILAMYLDEVYLGSGAFGLDEAARVYFDKTPAELTLAEAALLAGIPSHPDRYDPRRNPDAAEARRARVLEQMAANGWASDSEVAAARVIRP